MQKIDVIKGVGPSKLKAFEKMGVFTIRDLLFHFPFRYENLQVRPVESLLDQEKVTLAGKIVTQPIVNYYGHKKSRLTFRMAVSESQVVSIQFFNQPYLANSLELGRQVHVYGKWQSAKQSLMGMRIMKVDQVNQEMTAVYPSTQGLKQSQIQAIIKEAMTQFGHLIPEILPNYFNSKYKLISYADAVRNIHYPESEEYYKQAKRKIIYAEFFSYQYTLISSITRTQNKEVFPINYDLGIIKNVIKGLPFEPTQAQKKAINELFKDLKSEIPMKRMLQGDVGSGKTLVAFLAMLACVSAGYQVAMMVPTEILANQHCQAFNSLFNQFGFKATTLVSSIKSKEKTKLISEIEDGQEKILIGTHALIQENVKFSNLGFVVIDEQHRFGVGQRQLLFEKMPSKINLLQMTATPIPRSLALTLFGDMNVSTLDQVPKGRKPILTHWVKSNDIEQVYQVMIEQLQEGHQIYYVLPMIDVSETIQDVDNVIEVAQTLKDKFSSYHIDILHGTLSKDDQVAAMDRFKQGKSQILVATTMVEVGVDVPNATIIVIQSAERFGLAQLHQLRGRVGRNSLQSYCFLIGNPTTDQGKRRLEIMTESQDGFYISQEDMKIRGAGDLLGRDQSGIPNFRFANIIEDQHIMTLANQDVQDLLSGNITIARDELTNLNEWTNPKSIEI